MTLEDLENKFNSLAADHFDEAKQKGLKDTIFACEGMSARELMVELTKS
jgi:hypothetical protein